MTDQTFYNPLLDDEDDDYQPSAGTNPLLEDDEHELTDSPHRTVTPENERAVRALTDILAASRQPALRVTTEPEAPREPKFGEKGFGKGKPHPHKGSPRLKGNDDDAQLLAFGAKFSAFTKEAASMLRNSRGSRAVKGGSLLTERGVEEQLYKCLKLGYLEWRNALDGTRLWGPTQKGIGFARSEGFLLDDEEITWQSIQGFGPLKLDHYRFISHVASQLISPAGYFKESLGLDPVPLDQLHSDAHMTRVHKPIADGLKEQRAKGELGDYGLWRKALVQKIIERVKAGKTDAATLLERYPILLTLGLPRQEFGKPQVVNVKHPDLAVRLPNASNGAGRSKLFEIELSRKDAEKYEAILRTIKADSRGSLAYDEYIYLYSHDAIAKRIKEVDSDPDNDFGLIAAGKLNLIPITGRNGNRPVFAKRPSEEVQ